MVGCPLTLQTSLYLPALPCCFCLLPPPCYRRLKEDRRTLLQLDIFCTPWALLCGGQETTKAPPRTLLHHPYAAACVAAAAWCGGGGDRTTSPQQNAPVVTRVWRCTFAAGAGAPSRHRLLPASSDVRDATGKRTSKVPQDVSLGGMAADVGLVEVGGRAQYATRMLGARRKWAGYGLFISVSDATCGGGVPTACRSYRQQSDDNNGSGSWHSVTCMVNGGRESAVTVFAHRFQHRK